MLMRLIGAKEISLFLLNFFVVSVGVAMSTEFFEFHSACSVATILGCGVPRHTSRTFVGASATLCAF